MSPAVRSPEQRAKAAQAFVEVAFDDAFQLREEIYGEGGINARRKANREQLRSLRDQGHLTPEQQEALEELYPTRVRSDDDDDSEPQGQE